MGEVDWAVLVWLAFFVAAVVLALWMIACLVFYAGRPVVRWVKKEWDEYLK